MPTPSARKPAVVAAGALCWRETDGRLEVLVIHRPKYDDWSWPKGKQDEGETVWETAVREVREEVGLGIRLGPPLAVTRYPVAKGPKDVHYWAAEIPASTTAAPDEGEVDRLEWVSPKQARKRLTNASDVQPLDRLLELHEAGDLRTRQIIVLRHAKAKPRAAWSRAEGERPLAATGRRQAVGVGRLLALWGPDRVVSSPWSRCMQTVAGYAKAAKVPVREKKGLTEAEHRRKPGKAARLMESVLESSHSTVVCTHRPVLPAVLEVLRERVPARLREALPAKDPYLAPGEMLVLNLSLRHRRRVVSIERAKPFED